MEDEALISILDATFNDNIINIKKINNNEQV